MIRFIKKHILQAKVVLFLHITKFLLDFLPCNGIAPIAFEDKQSTSIKIFSCVEIGRMRWGGTKWNILYWGSRCGFYEIKKLAPEGSLLITLNTVSRYVNRDIAIYTIKGMFVDRRRNRILQSHITEIGAMAEGAITYLSNGITHKNQRIQRTAI